MLRLGLRPKQRRAIARADRLQASIKPHTTKDDGGVLVRLYYLKANKALRDVLKSAEAAAKVEASAAARSLLRNLVK